MANSKKTPTRPGAIRKAIERRIKDDDAKKWHWSFPMIRVIFSVDGQVQILERQIFQKSPQKTMAARNIFQLLNSAAAQVQQSLPDGVDKSTFKVLEAYLLATNYLGLMTVEEFWQGTQEASSDASQPSPAVPQTEIVAAGETPAGDNVVALKARPADDTPAT